MTYLSCRFNNEIQQSVFGCSPKDCEKCGWNPAVFKHRKELLLHNPIDLTPWELFDLITGTYYGRRFYFMQKNGLVHSVISGKELSQTEALNEFLDNVKMIKNTDMEGEENEGFD